MRKIVFGNGESVSGLSKTSPGSSVLLRVFFFFNMENI